METGKSQKCSRGCTGLGKNPEECDLQKVIAVLKLAEFRGKIVSLLWMHHEEEARGRHKNPVFQHFFSPKMFQQNHLSPECISVTRAKPRNSHWWQIYSSRFLTFVSCPEQGQLSAALCPTRSWEREGMERKPGTVFLGHVQCCFAVSCNMGIWDSAKAETLKRKKKKKCNSPGKSCW